MDDGVGGEDDDDDDGDYDGTIIMTTMRMMTTMTMRMMKSRNIHPPQPRVGKEGSGRHLRYLILLQPAGDGGVLFVFLFPFSYLSQVLSVFVQLAGLYVFTQPVEGQVIPCTSFQVHAYHICILFVCYN